MRSCTVFKVAGASLAMLSLFEFVWFATMSSSEKVSDHSVSFEDIADQPMPVDLLAALIQMLTFVSCRCVRRLTVFSTNHLLSQFCLIDLVFSS